MQQIFNLFFYLFVLYKDMSFLLILNKLDKYFANYILYNQLEILLTICNL